MLSLDYLKVEKLAAERGLSMRDLSLAMKMKSPNNLYTLKRNGGRARVKTIARIAKHFKCPIEDLLLPEPTPPKRRRSPKPSPRTARQ